MCLNNLSKIDLNLHKIYATINNQANDEMGFQEPTISWNQILIVALLESHNIKPTLIYFLLREIILQKSIRDTFV
jgi:hypothetical protein